MWVNKRERCYRRKLEQLKATEDTYAANAAFARACRAVQTMLLDPKGAEHLHRLCWHSATVGRSSRTAFNGSIEGTTLLEAAVLAAKVRRLLADAAFVAWARATMPDVLSRLEAPGALDATINPFVGSSERGPS